MCIYHCCDETKHINTLELQRHQQYSNTVAKGTNCEDFRFELYFKLQFNTKVLQKYHSTIVIDLSSTEVSIHHQFPKISSCRGLQI